MNVICNVFVLFCSRLGQILSKVLLFPSFLQSYFSDSASDASFDESGVSDAYYEALGTRPSLPDFEYSDRYTPAIGTFVCCTEEDYTKRPSASTLAESIDLIIEDFELTSDKENKNREDSKTINLVSPIKEVDETENDKDTLKKNLAFTELETESDAETDLK